jgi:hypothetical protein
MLVVTDKGHAASTYQEMEHLVEPFALLPADAFRRVL